MLLIPTATDRGLGLQPVYCFLAPLLSTMRNRGQRILYRDMIPLVIVHQAKSLPNCEWLHCNCQEVMFFILRVGQILESSYQNLQPDIVSHRRPHIIIEMVHFFPFVSTGIKSHYQTSIGFHWNTAKHISLKPIVASCPRTLLNPSEEISKGFHFHLVTSTINLATLLKGKF